MKKERKQKEKVLGRDVVSILPNSCLVSLSILCACALIVSAIKVCIFGFDTLWLIFFSFGQVIRVMLFDRAVTQGCWIKRHFVFFSSLILSAKTSPSEQEREGGRRRTEGDRNRQKNRPDDGVADRQVVEQPAVLDLACTYLGHCSSAH